MIKKSERGDDDINSNKFKSLEYRCFFKSLSKSEPLDSCNRRQNVRILEGVCSSKARKGTIQRIRTISRAVSIAKTVEPEFRKRRILTAHHQTEIALSPSFLDFQEIYSL